MKSRQLRALLDKARAGQRPVGLNVGLDCPSVIEITARFGFDWVIVDQEHTMNHGTRGLTEMVRAAELGGLPCFVKLNTWDALLARDALDAGAHAVMVPFVNRAEDLREMVSSIKFPPFGTRGYCSIARATSYATHTYSGHPNEAKEFMRFSNEDALIVPAIESVEAINNLDDILAVPECPIIHVGLDDLALSLGSENGPNMSRAIEAMKGVSKKVHAAGKLMSTFFTPREGVRADMADGIALFEVDLPYTGDTYCLALGLIEAVKTAEASRRPRDAKER